MADDLIERLRAGDGCAGEHVPGSAVRYEDTLTEAADEIERLQAEVAELRSDNDVHAALFHLAELVRVLYERIWFNRFIDEGWWNDSVLTQLREQSSKVTELRVQRIQRFRDASNKDGA